MSDTTKIIETFEKFKEKGWRPGGNGALALLCSITENSKKIYVTPNTTDKKKLTTNDLFLLRDLYGSQDLIQPLNQPDDNSKIADWAPVFLDVLARYPETKAVAQVITKWSALSARMALAAWKKTAENNPNVIRLSHWPLLRRLQPNRELFIPIINHGNPESMLAEARVSLSLYPETCAILVRDYGMVIWGETLLDLENKIEILEHLCELQIYSYALLSSLSLV
jgi:methylthioribulose-1-phosphate dehydratase